MVRSRLSLTKTIYSISIVNGILFSVFFLKLSNFYNKDINTEYNIDFSISADYIIWMFFVFSGPILHHKRERFMTEYQSLYGNKSPVSAKSATVFFCDFLPLMMSLVLLVRVLEWLFILL